MLTSLCLHSISSVTCFKSFLGVEGKTTGPKWSFSPPNASADKTRAFPRTLVPHPVLQNKTVTALHLLPPSCEEVHQVQLPLKHLDIFCLVLEIKEEDSVSVLCFELLIIKLQLLHGSIYKSDPICDPESGCKPEPNG